MASPKSSTPNVSSNAAKAASLPAGFQSIVMNDPFYDGEVTKLPLIGKFYDVVAMPPAMNRNDAGVMVEKPWNALRFIATQPTQAVTRDGELVNIAVDELVSIGESAAFKGIEGYACDPNFVREFCIVDLGKRPVKNGGGKTFRDFEIATLRHQDGPKKGQEILHARTLPAIGAMRTAPQLAAPVDPNVVEHQSNGAARQVSGRDLPAAS